MVAIEVSVSHIRRVLYLKTKYVPSDIHPVIVTDSDEAIERIITQYYAPARNAKVELDWFHS